MYTHIITENVYNMIYWNFIMVPMFYQSSLNTDTQTHV